MDKPINEEDNSRWQSVTIRIDTACGRMYVTYLHNDAFDLRGMIIDFGKNGNCMKTIMQVISRISMDTPDCEKLVRNFVEVACDKAFFIEGVSCSSCIDAIAKSWKRIRSEAGANQLRINAVMR